MKIKLFEEFKLNETETFGKDSRPSDNEIFNPAVPAKDDYKFTYMMLSRLQMDNDYFLGHGNRSESNHLWAGNVDDQIKEMKRLWNSLPADGKPEWLSMEDILDYEKKMKEDEKD